MEKFNSKHLLVLLQKENFGQKRQGLKHQDEKQRKMSMLILIRSQINLDIEKCRLSKQ